MRQEQFIQQHKTDWEKLEHWLEEQNKPQKQRDEAAYREEDIAQLYRRVCHHLALSQARLYSPVLIERLNRLVMQTHQRFYTHKDRFLHKLLQFYRHDFPTYVRQEWRLVAWASLLFYGPFFAMLITLNFYPDMVYTVMSGDQVMSMEAMYTPDLHNRLGRERETDTDVLMFGFYIKNNTSIGFQTFAGGLLFGIGTFFFLIFNGLFIGAAAGHLTQVGYIDTFWGFVSGHSAMELTAIVLSGAAGLKLGLALLSPKQKSRSRALLDNSRSAIKIVYGAATMFIIAAFIEAFWSSIAGMPVNIKYAVGISLWILVLLYFSFAGRQRAT